jgi:hypothetical protein
MFSLGIGLELIGFVSRRILQAGAFPEQPYGDRADPASSDVKPHGGNHLSEGHRGNNRHAAGVADRREARTAANLTQAQLADRLKTDQGAAPPPRRRRTKAEEAAGGKRTSSPLGDQVLALANGKTQQEIAAACKGARPNHVGAAIAHYKRTGRIEERDGKLYAT